MPYVKDNQKSVVDNEINALVDKILKETDGKGSEAIGGMWNYCFTRIILRTILAKFGKLRYELLERLDGTLGYVSKEIYRRVTIKYEDLKVTENGDVKEFIEIDRQLSEEKKKLQGKE